MKVGLKDNRGFTLTEIVIVIGILGIMIGGGIAGFGLLIQANVKQSATDLHTFLNKARVETMSKAGNPVFYVYRLTDGNYYYQFTRDDAPVLDNARGKKIAGNRARIIAVDEDADDPMIEVTGMDPPNDALRISFRKSTGAFLAYDDVGERFYSEILIVQGDVISYRLTLAKDTGRIRLERDGVNRLENADEDED